MPKTVKRVKITKQKNRQKKKRKDSKEKKYEDIVTDDAITDKGLFDIHQVDDKYDEIDSCLDVKCWCHTNCQNSKWNWLWRRQAKYSSFALGKTIKKSITSCGIPSSRRSRFFTDT